MEGKRSLTRLHARLTCFGGCTTHGFLHARVHAQSRASSRFTWFGLRSTWLHAPDALLQPAVATCRSSVLPRSSVRRSMHGGDGSSLLVRFSEFSRNVSFGVFDPFSFDFYIFKSVTPINKFSSRIL